MTTFTMNRLALSGALIVGIMALLAIFAPYVATFDPNEINLEKLQNF